MKVIRKIVFWFFLIVSVLFGIAILATMDGTPMATMNGTPTNNQIAIIILMTFIILPWTLYILIKYAINKRKKEKLKLEQELKELEERFREYKRIVEYENKILFVNEDKRLFSFGKEIYNFKDIISAEIVEDDNVITTTMTKNKVSLGKAVVGGALFGGVGAIIGGNAGKGRSISTNIQVCDKLQIKLTINSIEKPIVYINIITKRIRKKSKKYIEAYERAEHFLGAFQVIINNN